MNKIKMLIFVVFLNPGLCYGFNEHEENKQKVEKLTHSIRHNLIDKSTTECLASSGGVLYLFSIPHTVLIAVLLTGYCFLKKI